MVGRDRELARVMLLLDAALAGGGCLVLCTGEAGIGKTRLAEEVAASAAARGVPVAWARAADRDSRPPESFGGGMRATRAAADLRFRDISTIAYWPRLRVLWCPQVAGGVLR